MAIDLNRTFTQEDLKKFSYDDSVCEKWEKFQALKQHYFNVLSQAKDVIKKDDFKSGHNMVGYYDDGGIYDSYVLNFDVWKSAGYTSPFGAYLDDLKKLFEDVEKEYGKGSLSLPRKEAEKLKTDYPDTYFLNAKNLVLNILEDLYVALWNNDFEKISSFLCEDGCIYFAFSCSDFKEVLEELEEMKEEEKL